MIGFLLLLPSASKVYSYCLFRSQSMVVNGIIEKPLFIVVTGASVVFLVFRDGWAEFRDVTPHSKRMAGKKD